MRKMILLGMHAIIVCSLPFNSIAQTTVISHNFDSSDDGWTLVTNTNGSWTRGAAILDAGSDGSYWHSSPSDYSDNAITTVESSVLDFSSFADLVLKVDVRYNTEGGYDGMQLEYNDGVGWNVLGAVGDGLNWYNETDLDGIGADEDGWAGDNSSWQTAIITLPAILDNNAAVQFRFRFQSDGNLVDEGVAFDNFIVTSGGANIYVSGNGNEIEFSDDTPSNLDDTDFRSVGVTFAGSKLKTYTIINTGGGTLNLTGPSPVSISGTHAADYSVGTQPGTLVLDGGESTNFTIAFNPSVAGLRTAEISIASDDANEDPFTFSIQGTGVDEEVYHSFDAGDEGWTVTSNTNGNWSRGTAMLSEGADGSYWHTTPAGAYNDNAILTIQSPIIDLTGATDLMLYLDIRYDTEADWDGFRVEYSSDGGTGWNDLGVIGDGVNWYNDTDVDGIADTQDGWSGDNGRWQTAEIELPAILENNNNTRYRLNFGSDGIGDADAGVAFDNFMISVGVPDIYIDGNGIEIVNGTSTSSNLVGTNFRNVDITSGTKTNTFTIYNKDGGTLNLTGTPFVDITGVDAADFTVTTQPGLTALGFNESTTFTITFDPTTVGDKNAIVSIESDDSDEDPYTFAIAGVGDDAIVYHNFDASDEGWSVTSNTNGNWLRGSAILATGADGSYWHTDPSTYSNDALLTLTSSVIDLTGESKLSLHIDLRYSTEALFDGYRIEYSDDNGSNWNLLGSFGEGLNWYNDSDVDAFGDAEDGWSGDNGSWQTAEIDLPSALEDNAQAVFRVSFVSDAGAVDVGAAFDNFAIYGGVTPLPVELLSFVGEDHLDHISLNWSTASELNNDYFEVQRSSDGVEFETIGAVDGNGTINEMIDYEFVDMVPLNGHNFYRLVQYDYDGAFEIHRTISVEHKVKSKDWEVVAFPNPILDDRVLTLRVHGDNQVAYQIKIISISGKTVFQELKVAKDEMQNMKIQLNNLEPGLYGLSVGGAVDRYFTKIILK